MKYPKHWVRYAAGIADVSERTIVRWARDGLDITDNAAILQYKRARRHPLRGPSSVKKEPEGQVYPASYYAQLAELARR
jgi:hypothetical protein